MAENQQVKHPDPIGIRFDPSGRISRVIMEVGPHLDLATFTPFKFSYNRSLLSHGVNVCIVLNSDVCVDNTIK